MTISPSRMGLSVAFTVKLLYIYIYNIYNIYILYIIYIKDIYIYIYIYIYYIYYIYCLKDTFDWFTLFYFCMKRSYS